MDTPSSERLDYVMVSSRSASSLQALARDDHVRRYLLDGVLVPDGWAEAEVRRADELRRRTGLGLYLVRERGEGRASPAIGFCGFRVFDEHGPEPELLYAFLEPFTGRGYATEAARACVALARALERRRVVAAVDEVNTASTRVLDKVGFRRTTKGAGAFGPVAFFELDLRRS